jgi:hypothetical protein
MRRFIKSLLIILIVSLLVAAFIRNRPASYKLTGYTRYIIQDGDTLWGIADKHRPEGMTTKNFVAELQFVNNCNEIIYSGKEILIPNEVRE